MLDLVEKQLVTDQIVLDIGYDIENLTNPDIRKKYHGEVKSDRYGRFVPKHAHGTANLDTKTSSTAKIMDAVLDLYERIVDKNLLVRVFLSQRTVLWMSIWYRMRQSLHRWIYLPIIRHWQRNRRQSRREWKKSADCRR